MQFLLAIPQRVMASVAVSNIGRVSMPETYGPFSVEEISFLGSNTLFVGILAVNVSSFRDKIFLNFAFSEPSLSRERMDTLVQHILHCLKDACAQISQQFTLWSQAGSKVIRGDLLVIPIDQSLLYVEPVYLRAEQGELPELKRVIVADGENVVMTDTLETALAAISGKIPITSTPAATTPSGTTTLVQQALTSFQKAQAALKQGNWADYGRYQQELEQLLKQLNQQTPSKP